MEKNKESLGGVGIGAPVLAVKELAARWRLDPKTIREAIELGQIPAFRVGKRRVLIPLTAVLKLEQGRVGQTGES